MDESLYDVVHWSLLAALVVSMNISTESFTNWSTLSPKLHMKLTLKIFEVMKIISFDFVKTIDRFDLHLEEENFF